jgi:hypothetical protein
LTIDPQSMPPFPASRHFETRCGSIAEVWLLPPDHWSHDYPEQFVLGGRIGKQASMWRLDGSWASRGKHDLDLVGIV